MASRALLSGAYGYLGAVIRASLDTAGWETIALVRTPRPGDRAVEWALGDELPQPLVGADVLVHCAYDFRPRERADIWRVNVQGSATLLRSALARGVSRSIVLSSMSAYEGTRQLYGQAKLAIEEHTLSMGGIAIRPGLVYGPEPAGMAGALLKLTRLPLLPMIGGSARQFPVHEEDLAAVLVELLEGETWTPEVIGVAQATSVSFRSLLLALAAREGRTPRLVPIPWQPVYAALRLTELVGLSAPLRADSVLGLVHPARSVPASIAYPQLLRAVRILAQPTGDAHRHER